MKFILNIVILLTFSYILNANETQQIKLGIDVLESNNFDLIKGKRVGLLTNHSGRNNKGKLTANILKNAKDVNLVSLFVPEHGFYTTIPAGQHVDDDSFEGVKVLSLYGKNRRPSKEYLQDLDIVIIDIQDIGIRSYTFLSTVFYMLDACGEYGKEVIVLDRPNPMGGIIMDGNVVKKGHENFISILPISYIHGCTFGELAKMMNGENWLKKKCELTVIKMRNWKRWMQWEDTNLEWFPTSPHIPTVNAIRGAAVLGIWGELGFMSIGIGTTSPFQYLGHINLKNIEQNIDFNGFYLSKSFYRPFYGMSKGKNVPGYILKFKKDNSFEPYTSGVELMFHLKQTNPKLFNPKNHKKKSIRMFKMATGTDALYNIFFSSNNWDLIRLEAQRGLVSYAKMRNKYLIYD